MSPLIAATIVMSTIVVAARLVSAWLAALGRSVFGGRQITAGRPVRTSATVPSTTPAKVATSAVPAAGTLTTTIGARRVILSGIVLGRKVLRRGSVRIRLTFFRVAGMSVIVSLREMRLQAFFLTYALFGIAGLRVVRDRIVRRRFIAQ